MAIAVIYVFTITRILNWITDSFSIIVKRRNLFAAVVARVSRVFLYFEHFYAFMFLYVIQSVSDIVNSC